MVASGPHVPGSHPTSCAFLGQLRPCNRFVHHFFEKVLPALCGKHIFASHPIAFGVQKSHFQPSKGGKRVRTATFFLSVRSLVTVVSPFFRAMDPSRIAFSPVTCAHLSSMGVLGADLEPTLLATCWLLVGFPLWVATSPNTSGLERNGSESSWG